MPTHKTPTLHTLQEKFDLDYNAINNLQKGFSPATEPRIPNTKAYYKLSKKVR